MNALWKLEQGGIRFELAADGQITYRNTWPDDVGREDAAMDWIRPLLAELKANRDELADILLARAEWTQVFDEWSRALAVAPDDPERDMDYLRRLKGAAVRGRTACYDGGPDDLGAAGWERVTERQIDNLSRKENDKMGIKIEQTTYDAVPTGDYKAVITGIEQVEGKFGPQLQIKSEINAGPYAGNTFLCWVSPKFSPKSRLYEWVEAALAMPVPKSYTFDSDHLIGREVTATLVVRELDGGGEVNRVDRVRAA